MFEVYENHIHLTRGDKAVLNFSVRDYLFKSGDKVRFKVYEKKLLNKAPLLSKVIEIEEDDKDEVTIELTSQETKIGGMLNEPKDYWYEIELNGDTTVVGFDKKGAKILTLYPEGADINE